MKKNRGTYRLIDGINTPQTIRVVVTENGKPTYGTMRLLPGEVYQLEDDDNFINSLKAAITSKPYSESLKKTLDSVGVQYKHESGCQSCGGRGGRLKYCVVEVNENET